jgi:membrane protein YqaA with SNARE-associated domain
MNQSKQIATVSKWHLLRRLYDWVLSSAHSKYATCVLFCLSFAEASCFPIAPDILQIPLTLERPDRAWYYATINTIGSVLGGLFGYFIGATLWHFTSHFFLTYVFSESTFNDVGALYHKWDAWVILAAAFTPIPYKIFTIAAGVFHISLVTFFLTSIVGRAARFFLVAALLWKWGESTKLFIEKYFNLLTLLFLALLIGGVMLLRYFHV